MAAAGEVIIGKALTGIEYRPSLREYSQPEAPVKSNSPSAPPA